MNDLKRRFPREVNNDIVYSEDRLKIFSELDYDEKLFNELALLYQDEGRIGYFEFVSLYITEEEYKSLSKEKQNYIVRCQLNYLNRHPGIHSTFSLSYVPTELEEALKLSTL